jgi:tetrahydromethanopterin S-methyltransferase subunit B
MGHSCRQIHGGKAMNGLKGFFIGLAVLLLLAMLLEIV